MNPAVDESAPVLVGIGLVNDRTDEPTAASEPLALMAAALDAAATDAGAGALLPEVGRILVPRGRWRYRDPGRALAGHMGAPAATTVLARVGVLQQRLVADACRRIADGEIEVAAVVGGEAGNRLRQAQRSGVDISDTDIGGEPDVLLTATADLAHPAELGAGLHDAVGFYALLDSAFRAEQGWSVDEARTRVANLYEAFSRVAAANPDAWRRAPVSAADVREPSPVNPMLAFPYTRRHTTAWNVNQAAALVFCSAATARRHGIPEDRWIFPWVSVESNLMVPVAARPRIARSPGAQLAGQAAFAHAGLTPEEIDRVDLYSCFPVAVQMFAAELGLPAADCTVTGGMAQAGGPFNSYTLHATGTAARLLRADPAGSTALVTGVSGVMTKQSVAIWGNRPGPAAFAALDVTADAARCSPPLDVTTGYRGVATICASTVLHHPTADPVAVAVLDAAPGLRTVASSTDPATVSAFETGECCGAEAAVDGQALGELLGRPSPAVLERGWSR